MDIAGTDQDDIPGFKAVGDAFYKIVHIAGIEKQNFKEIMVMAVIAFHFMVCQVKQLKGTVQISCFFIIRFFHQSFLKKTPGTGDTCIGSFLFG